MLRICWLAAGVLALLSAGSLAADPGGKLGAGIMSQLGGADTAHVFVLLQEPDGPARRDLRSRQTAVRAARQAVLRSLRPNEVRPHRQFSIVNAFSASVTAEGLRELLDSPAVLRVEPPQYASAALPESVQQIRADLVQRRGHRGQGVTVAVLDAGFDTTNPDLAGSIADEHCFCRPSCCPDGTHEQAGAGSASDGAAHGTHVAGIIASRGVVAPVGVAPAAQILAVKILNSQDQGTLEDAIAALDWIATERPDVQVINMSIASNAVYPRNDQDPVGPCDTADGYTTAFAQILEALRARGTLTFAASGNNGDTAGMAAPACVSAAVAVGAVTDADGVWPMSNSNVKLDLLAPGVDVLSSGPAIPFVCTGTDLSARCTGTSLAVPHATGTAALLLDLNPGLGADRLEAILKATGVPVVDWRTGLVFPRIDALAAMYAVLELTRPLLGGGSRSTDCLVEWNVIPAGTTRPMDGASCRDGDVSCDTDVIAGQCTFQVSACFRVPDRRLPACDPSVPVTEYSVAAPTTEGGSDAVDAANAAAIRAVLPPLPITDPNQCTESFAFVVPAGESRWIRFAAGTGALTDYDRLRFHCDRSLQAEEEPHH
jgi:subtilisin family serine protease